MKKIVLFLLLAAPLAAEVPNRITYQGRLARSGVSVGGSHTFRACLRSGASNLWCNDYTLVLPTSGDFTLVLAPPATIDWLNTPLQIELTVDGQTLSPADDFTSVPYALAASSAMAVDASGVHLTSTQDLDSWQSAANPHLIDPAKLDVAAAPPTTPGAGLVPQGAIILWDQSNSCPSGYTRVATLDGRFPRGAAVPGTTGGAATHEHTMEHTHDLSNHTHGGTTQDGGVNHTHSGSTGFEGGLVNSGAGNPDGAVKNHTHAFTTGGASAYMHSHLFTTGLPSINASGGANPSTTVSASSLPPYTDILFCRKN